MVAIAVAGTSFALQAGPFRDSAVVPPVSDSTPPREMPGTLVAHGTAEDGSHWWLSAYENDAGELCVDLQHNGVIAEDCAFYDSEGTGLGRHPDPDADPQSLFGWVPDDTATMWVTASAEMIEGGRPEDDAPEDDGNESEDGAATTSDQDDGGVETSSDLGCPGVETRSDKEDDGGVETSSDLGCPGVETSSDKDDDGGVETSSDNDDPDPERGPNIEFRGENEVRLYDAPDGFRFPVKFYAVVPAPADATAFRIEIRNGDATVLIFARRSPDFAEEPEYPGELVADGSHAGQPWVVYVRTQGENRCISLIWADEAYGSSEGCSSAVPEAESFQFTMNRFDGEESSTIVFFAALARDVARLELEIEGGETLPVQIQPGPPGSEVDYGVASPPLPEDGSLEGWAISYDADGNVLDRMELCDLAPSSGCASGSRLFRFSVTISRGSRSSDSSDARLSGLRSVVVTVRSSSNIGMMWAVGTA